MVNWRIMPITPRIAVAKPTLCGSMPNPPVKMKGRLCTGLAGSFESYRGVERKRSQRLLNALLRLDTLLLIRCGWC